jgi:outer membrane protein assembly factor BamB
MRLVACFTLLVLTTPAPAGDWPQWLGPNRDGSTAEIVKPWKDAPKVLWRQPVGEGHSSPVVASDSIFLHFKAPGKDEEQIVFYDAESGIQRGKFSHDRNPFTSPFGGGPRATPAIGLVGFLTQCITFGVTGRLSGERQQEAFNDPKPRWSMDAVAKFKAQVPKFGVSASPIIDGQNVIIMVGGKGASLVAYNRSSGEIAWKALDDPASYASPIITEHGGKRQLVALTGEAVVSLDPMTGGLYWRYPFRDAINESSTTPLRVGDLIVASSVTLGSVGLKLGAKDGKPAVTEAWKNPALCCYFSTPVAVGDKYLYMVTGSLAAAMMNKPESALNCVEAATGKVLWTKPKVGKFHAALIRTGDNKLLMLSDTGDLTMIDPDPKEYRELARAKVCGETWAHPALANGRLYLRDNKELICLQLGN